MIRMVGERGQKCVSQLSGLSKKLRDGMNGAPIRARILYSIIVAWVGFIFCHDIVLVMWSPTSGSWLRRVQDKLVVIFVIVFFGFALYCAVTGRITADTDRFLT